MKTCFSLICVLAVFNMLLVLSCKKKDSEAGNSGTLSGTWQQTKGPCNGDISCIAMDGNMIYAGSYGDGMFVSDDQGSTWSQVTNGISTSSYPVAVVTRNDTTIVACQYLYRSTDKGKSWTKLGNGLFFQEIKSLTWTGNRILVCCFYDGPVYYSDDSGQNWNHTQGNVTDYDISGGTTLGGELFVASRINGIYKSVDNGQTFALSNNGLTNTHVTCIKTSGDRIYAGTDNGLYLSVDHAASWNLISDAQMSGKYLRCLAIDGLVIIAGSEDGLFISQDSGVTWTAAVNGLPDRRIQSVAFQGSTFLAGTLSGVYISQNGGTLWKAIGLPNTYVNFLSSNGADLFSSAFEMTGGIFVTQDHGDSWSFLREGLPTNTVYSIAWNGTDMLAATDSGVYVSGDRGLNWTKKSNGLPVDQYNPVFCVAGSGLNLYAGIGFTGLYVSHDGGDTWVHASLPTQDNYKVNCLYVNSSGVYAGTLAGILFSPDNGQTWSARNIGLPQNFNCTSMIETASQLFISSTKYGVYMSSNGGNSWMGTGNALSGKPILNLATDGKNIIAAAFTDGVYMSQDLGNTWFQVNAGFPTDNKVMCVEMNGSWLFAGTHGYGVWRHSF